MCKLFPYFYNLQHQFLNCNSKDYFNFGRWEKCKDAIGKRLIGTSLADRMSMRNIVYEAQRIFTNQEV